MTVFALYAFVHLFIFQFSAFTFINGLAKGSRILVMLFIPLLLSIVTGGLIFSFIAGFSIRTFAESAGMVAGYVMLPHLFYFFIFLIREFVSKGGLGPAGKV